MVAESKVCNTETNTHREPTLGLRYISEPTDSFQIENKSKISR